MRASLYERGRSPTLRYVGYWAALAALAFGCASERSPRNYFEPRGEVFLSPKFSAEQLVVVEGALSAWSEATAGEVAFQVRVGEGFPRIAPAREDAHIRGEFMASDTPEIALDTRKAADAPALRNLTLHEVGHALGLSHIARNDSVMFPFATTLQELDPWTLAAWRERQEQSLAEGTR